MEYRFTLPGCGKSSCRLEASNSMLVTRLLSFELNTQILRSWMAVSAALAGTSVASALVRADAGNSSRRASSGLSSKMDSR